jgi:hypothetical protein
VRLATRHYQNSDTYKGGAWAICDRCSQRVRRSRLYTEWDGLKVDLKCLDPRPPQQTPPNVYPEGIPFLDARPPQDLPDRLLDETSLQSVTGGFKVSPPGQLHPDGQNQLPGALSPQPLIESPTPLGTNWDQGVYSGGESTGVPYQAQTAGAPPPLPWQTVPNDPAQVVADDVTFITGYVGARDNSDSVNPDGLPPWPNP